jgi:hypothetical protein
MGRFTLRDEGKYLLSSPFFRLLPFWIQIIFMYIQMFSNKIVWHVIEKEWPVLNHMLQVKTPHMWESKHIYNVN